LHGYKDGFHVMIHVFSTLLLINHCQHYCFAMIQYEMFIVHSKKLIVSQVNLPDCVRNRKMKKKKKLKKTVLVIS